MISQKIAWNKSYKKKDNFLLYPNEEVIRFFNNHIKRKNNLKINKFNNKIVLDLGCGSGRHLKYCIENGYYVIGLDLSLVALKQSRWLLKKNKFKNKKDYKLINSSSSKIPLKNSSVDYLISHATLDSMMSSEIKKSVEEIYRVLKNKSLVYIDLISNKEKRIGRFINKFDQIIDEAHENGTIQSYFNIKRIKKLFCKFKIIELYRIDKINKKLLNSRYHLILKVCK